MLIIYAKQILDNYSSPPRKRQMGESERFTHLFDKFICLVLTWSEIRVRLITA